MNQPTVFNVFEDEYIFDQEAPPPHYVKRLGPGIWRYFEIFQGPQYLERQVIKSDALLPLPEDITSSIIAEVKQFFSPETEAAYKKYNLLHRRGVLMHGRPGTGKSCTVYRIMSWAVQNDIIVLLEPPPPSVPSIVKRIRGIEGQDRPILVVWEELEHVIASYEVSLLELLDGNASIDNVFYIATTNYIKLIPNRIKNRPSRFATVKEVGPPSLVARKMYIESKLDAVDLKTIDMDVWLKLTDNMIIDEIKDLIVSVFCFKWPLDEASTRIREMSELAKLSEED